MTIAKSELRAAGMNEVGNRLDDALEVAKHEIHRAEGAVRAATQLYQKIVNLTAEVDKEVEEGTLTLEESSKIKTWLAQAQAEAKQTGKSENKIQQRAEGVTIGLQKAVEITKKLFDQETLKAETQKAVLEDDDYLLSQLAVPSQGTVPGLHPGMTLKERRNAEEAAAKKAVEEATEKAKAPVEAKKEDAPVKATEETPAPPKRKRGRPRKKKPTVDNAENSG